MHRSVTLILCGVGLLCLTSAPLGYAADAPTAPPLSLIVMDPLAAPLSCPCVEGYAQRRYEVLAELLQQELNRKVQLTFSESLATALKKTRGRADLVIGKDSVVRADAKTAGVNVLPLGQLTDKQGSTEQHGLIVVNRTDPATEVQHLKDYTIIFGPAIADEKHAAALTLLRDAGVTIPAKLTIDDACSDGACKVIDLGPTSRTAAVISSYAQPLLEGCGTIRKGDLRVVARTAPVPFITAFASAELDAAERDSVQAALLSVSLRPDVLEALESLVGFLPPDKANTTVVPVADAAVAKKK
ncbi:MAG: PhnD/SsuA/transferrin family substrate-binding protein [Fuerstiella sp.]